MSASTACGRRTPVRGRSSGVFTDYGNGPGFNLSVIDVAVLSQHESGAEFAAGPKTKIGKQAHAFDRCEVNGTVFGVGPDVPRD